jgi:ligand-binding sensor domain-containing protein/two-component sensor histidine kinase
MPTHRKKAGYFYVFFLGIASLLMLCLNKAASAQDYLYYTKNITVDVNLSHKDVHCVVKDEQGFFWAATWNGLYRFDGFNTEHVPIMPGDAPIRIQDMILRNGLLYLGTEYGLKCLRISDRALIQMPGVPTTDTVIRIRMDDRGRLWWLSHKGTVSRLDKGRLKKIHISAYSSSVFGALEIAEDHVWVSSYDRKLFRIDPERVEITGSVFTPEGAFVNNIMVDPEGKLNLLCQDMVYRINSGGSDTPELIPRPEFGKGVTQFLVSKLGVFVVRDRNLFGHYYESKGKYVYREIPWFQEKPENTNHIQLFGNILLVCYRSGMLMVNIAENRFDPLHITYHPGTDHVETARAVEEDDRNIYLATYDAIYRIDKQTGREQRMTNDKWLYRDITRQADTMWVASEGLGLLRMDLNSGRIVRVGTADKQIQKILICVSPLGKDRLLLGGYDGIAVYNKGTDRLTDLEPKYKGRKIADRLIFQVEALDDHRFILSGQAGVYLMDDRGRVIRRYAENVIGEDGLEPLCFWRAPDGSLWIGTTGGLFHVGANGVILDRLTMEDGLAGEIVATLTPDEMGRLWAATYNGLSCISLEDLNIRNFRKEDGLPENEFNQVSNRLMNDGRLILGTMNGFIRLDPDRFPKNLSRSLKLQVSRIEKGDQLRAKTEYGFDTENGNEIRIGKGVNYVKISFALLPVGLNAGNMFEYRIRGVHQAWIRMGQDPTIVIDNFKKGEYVLEVRCITGLGSQEIAMMELPLIVEEYFFRETWFYVLMITLLLSALILFMYGQLQKKKRIEEVRQELSQNLHDEMGTYLTTIGMNAEMLSNKLPENRNVESIRKMSRHAMDFIKDNLWTLDSSSDNALQLWDRIKSIASESCESLGIRCEFTEINGLEHIKLSMKQKNSLLLIAKELLNNAIKHGDRQVIKLEWVRDRAGHRILMSNRVGYKNAEGSGTGIFNVSKRIEDLGGTMTAVQQDDRYVVSVWLIFIK